MPQRHKTKSHDPSPMSPDMSMEMGSESPSVNVQRKKSSKLLSKENVDPQMKVKASRNIEKIKDEIDELLDSSSEEEQEREMQDEDSMKKKSGEPKKKTTWNDDESEEETPIKHRKPSPEETKSRKRNSPKPIKSKQRRSDSEAEESDKDQEAERNPSPKIRKEHDSRKYSKRSQESKREIGKSPKEEESPSKKMKTKKQNPSESEQSSREGKSSHKPKERDINVRKDKKQVITKEDYRKLKEKYEKLRDLRETEAERMYEELKQNSSERERSLKEVIDQLKKQNSKLRDQQNSEQTNDKKHSLEVQNLQLRVTELESQLKKEKKVKETIFTLVSFFEKLSGMIVTPLGEGRYECESSPNNDEGIKFVLTLRDEEVEYTPLKGGEDILPDYMKEVICFEPSEMPKFWRQLSTFLFKSKKTEDEQSSFVFH